MHATYVSITSARLPTYLRAKWKSLHRHYILISSIYPKPHAWHVYVSFTPATLQRYCITYVQSTYISRTPATTKVLYQVLAKWKSLHRTNVFIVALHPRPHAPDVHTCSSGSRKSKARPFLFSPRAVRPTRWMYSLGSSGGSNWIIQSTAE